ncbi:putative transposase [Escherichia coli DEC12A]|nr:putative transposase [Escherichia coli DEC12A]
MDTSLAHENARLRALLQTQQDTIRQMAKYNRLLSQRVAAYASEINRLKALVAKLQRMQFGKSSEKLRAKTERQIQEAQERISALQEEMAETLGEQYDPVLPSALRQSSARKPLPASLPRETRVIRPEEECCPACGGDLSPLGCDVSEQLELISSAFKVSKHNVRNWRVVGATISCRQQYLQNPLHAVMPERGFWPMLLPGNMQTICRYTASQKYTVARAWS